LLWIIARDYIGWILGVGVGVTTKSRVLAHEEMVALVVDTVRTRASVIVEMGLRDLLR
jgi:hypothetical protein